MLSSFVPITPHLRTQNPIRKRNGLGEPGSINLSMRPFSTLGNGYNFLLASSLLNTRAPSLLSLITSCTLKAATDYCGQNIRSFKKSGCCKTVYVPAVFKNCSLVRSCRNEKSSGNRPFTVAPPLTVLPFLEQRTCAEKLCFTTGHKIYH